MRLLLFLAISFVTLISNAQMKEWGWQEIDTAYIVCQYKHQKYDGLNDFFDMDDMRLEIGSQLTKFYSYTSWQYDSLRSTPSGKDYIRKKKEEAMRNTAGKTEKEQVRILKDMPGYGTTLCSVYKEKRENKFIVQDALSINYYQYEETIEIPDWNILPDTAMILNYPCQKAICTWRGRNYTAWFTENIPISEGPYKFHGLPGLIMKITDEKNHYSWEIKGIEKVQAHPIYFSKPPFDSNAEYELIGRKELIKKQYNSEKRRNQALSNMLAKIGKPVYLSDKNIVGPIELDFK